MLIACVMDKSITIASGPDHSSLSVALVSSDIDIFVRSIESFHEAWASPVEVILGVYILQRQVGLGTIGPALVITGTFNELY